MEPERAEFPLKSPLGRSVAALLLFAVCSLFFYVFKRETALGMLLLALSVGMTVLACLAIANLLRHEGWSVVIGREALELPTAPYKSAKRERIRYQDIEFVGLAPRQGTPSFVTIHVLPGPQIRWIRQDDLRTGSVVEVASVLSERVTHVRGDGKLVSAEFR